MQQPHPDSVQTINFKPFVFRLDTFVYRHHPYYHFTNPTKKIASQKQWEGKEIIFYTVLGLLLFFAFIKNGFGRYLQDLFRLFFRTTLKQRQLKEQLMQTPLPSLLLNLLFVFSAALYSCLLLQQFNMGSNYTFLHLYGYCLGGIAAIYLVKFIALKLSGWILNLSESTDTYIFIVFTANKIIGVLLLPFLILLGFTTGVMYQIALLLSVIILGGLFSYRFYLSYVSLHRHVKINPFHFLIYLAAFEVVPLLLINKVLFTFLG